MSLYHLISQPEELSPTTPLLVLLHGYGSNEEDLFSFTSDLPKTFLVVSFRAPINLPLGGFAWYDIDFMNTEKFINVEQAQNSMQAILESIEQLKKTYNLSNSDTHLCGFSQGGILCYALAFTYPTWFRKLACLSAYPEPKILQKTPSKKEIERLSFFVSHGLEDMVIPIEWARKGTELLYDVGAYFTFREYPSGHGLNPKNYMDLMVFFGD